MIYAVIVLIIIGIIYYVRRKKSDNAEAPQEADDDNATQQVTPVTEMPVVIVNNGVRMEGALKMTQGLQVFDASGNIILDVTDRITKYLGSLEIEGTDGSVTVDGLSDGELWYYIKDYSITTGLLTPPTITKNGDILSWTYNYPDTRYKPMYVTIIYGIY